MKYMKLGSKPDFFQTSNNTTSVCSEIASDIIFQVEGSVFNLHKFPVLSKCGRLQEIALDCSDEIVTIEDIPGGVKAFELCAKFCYGIAFTLNAHNVMSVRCAADYLGMTEALEKGNLIFKLEVFLSSSIFTSWKDSIIALKTMRPLLPWSQDLQMISRCIDSIASKMSVDPTRVDWSFTYTRKGAKNGTVTHDGAREGQKGSQCRLKFVPKDWWVEDISGLDIELYCRVMVTIKTKGLMSHKDIGEALQVYAYMWLPGLSKENTMPSDHGDNRDEQSAAHCELIEKSMASKHKMLVEKIVGLLPDGKRLCSCSFISRMLKAATILRVDTSTKMELASRIGCQLEEASLNDLLIPSLSYASDALYDVDLVQQIVEHFLVHNQSPLSCSPVHSSTRSFPINEGHMMRDYEECRSLSTDRLDFMVSHASTPAPKLKVAKLIDTYLAEIARDATLPLAKFIKLAETIPEFARPVHDGLYRAIDIYLTEHCTLTKSEKKRLCRLMDCKKLSMDACMHAAQNERLPLRVVVQVLFFEQVRAATAGCLLQNELPRELKASLKHAMESSLDDHTGRSNAHIHPEEEGFHALHGARVAEMKRKIGSPQPEVFTMKQSKAKSLFSSSKRMLNRLLSVKHSSSSGSKDSDISKSSGSSVSSSATSNKMELEKSTKLLATRTTTSTKGAAAALNIQI